MREVCKALPGRSDAADGRAPVPFLLPVDIGQDPALLPEGVACPHRSEAVRREREDAGELSLFPEAKVIMWQKMTGGSVLDRMRQPSVAVYCRRACHGSLAQQTSSRQCEAAVLSRTGAACYSLFRRLPSSSRCACITRAFYSSFDALRTTITRKTAKIRRILLSRSGCAIHSARSPMAAWYSCSGKPIDAEAHSRESVQ